MKFSFYLLSCISLIFMPTVVSRLSKIRKKKNDSILRGFYPGSEKKIYQHNLSKVRKFKKFNLNPLSIKLGLHRYQELLFASNLKSFFESMYKGFVKIMYKFNIKPTYVDKHQRKIIQNYDLLDSIKCKDVHLLIDKKYNLKNLSYELANLNQYNYKLKPRFLISNLQSIASTQAINCPALMNYINLFYSQIENLDYLNNDDFNSSELLTHSLKYKMKYFKYYGKYNKMGYFLGKLLGWFRGYPQSDSVNQIKLNSVMREIYSSV